jgi:hypothetical protein
MSTLRHILDGGMASLGAVSSPTGPILDLAGEWEKLDPDLFAPDSFPTQPLSQAASLWRKGELQEAVAALCACIRPITIDNENSGFSRPQVQPNPLALSATILLADLR